MRIFDYVAEYEDLQRDLAGVMCRLGLNSAPLRVNETKTHAPDYTSRKAEIVGDPVAMAALRDILSDKIKFYEHALARP